MKAYIRGMLYLLKSEKQSDNTFMRAWTGLDSTYAAYELVNFFLCHAVAKYSFQRVGDPSRQHARWLTVTSRIVETTGLVTASASRTRSRLGPIDR